jgi:hypothetical protein
MARDRKGMNMGVPNTQALRNLLEELAKDEECEQYVGDCAYHEGYEDGQIALAKEILNDFFSA